MIIDGKALSDTILANLAQKTAQLASMGITPTLAVILVGDNPASLAYIKQKQKAAERIGASIIFSHQSSDTRPEQLKNLIDQFNVDAQIHGLIVQRPIPTALGDVSALLNSVVPSKDVDGFVPQSPFDVPVALAVATILKSTHADLSQHIVVIGRGDTAGKPIAEYFQKQKYHVSIVHSQTANAQEIIQSADIIISCVGKERVVTQDTIKPGAILISVGIWRDTAGKLRGDYDESDIADVASWYTPTPGGVGPVNVACLMQNLIKASSINTGGKNL